MAQSQDQKKGTITLRDMGPILAELQQLREENIKLLASGAIDANNNVKLRGFVRKVLQTAFEGCGLDGGDIQDLGVKHGLLIEDTYDPEKHGENFSGDFEIGDLIYMYSDILKE